MKKILLSLLIILVIGVLGFFIYIFFFTSEKSLQAIYAVPENAVFVIETVEPVDAWQNISHSDIWSHLRQNDFFGDLTVSADYLDSLIRENETILDLIGHRTVVISAHMYTSGDYDFLYTIDLGKASRLSALQNHIDKMLGSGFSVTRRDHLGNEIVEVKDKETRQTFYLSFINNLVLISYTHTIIEDAIEQQDAPVIGRELNFISVNEKVAGDGMFRLYIHHNYLDEYVTTFMEGENEYVSEVSQSLAFTGLAGEITESNMIRMEGYSTVVDSFDSYLLASLRSGTGDLEIPEIAPQRTAFYLGLGFESFLNFYDNFDLLLREKNEEYKQYNENITSLENYLSISVRDNFISWIDDELAYLQIHPVSQQLEPENALVLKAKDIEEATDNLDHIKKMVRKRTPGKFREVEYKGYTISYLSIKGFFKLILGSFFEKFDKPYYTFIDDYVVFSEHPQTIKSIIDDYENDLTLDESSAFHNFISHFEDDNNVFMFVNTPVIHSNMQELVNPETWEGMQKNSDYIITFSQIGFQLAEKDGMFDTKLLTQFNKDVLHTAQPTETVSQNSPDTAATDTAFNIAPVYISDFDMKNYVEEYKDGTVKREVNIRRGKKHGRYKEYYPNGELKLKGSFNDGQMNGNWRLYDSSGNLIEKRKYDDGVLQN